MKNFRKILIGLFLLLVAKSAFTMQKNFYQKDLDQIVDKLIDADVVDRAKMHSYEYYHAKINKIIKADDIDFEEKKYAIKLNDILFELYYILDLNANNSQDFYFLVWRAIDFGIKHYGFDDVLKSYYWAKISNVDVGLYCISCELTEFSIISVVLIEKLKENLNINNIGSVKKLKLLSDIKLNIETNLQLIYYCLNKPYELKEYQINGRGLVRIEEMGVFEESSSEK